MPSCEPETLVEHFRTAAALAGVAIAPETIRVEQLLEPHEPGALSHGWMAVYVFIHRDSVLKIGKAGPASNARFQSQHYRADSSNSNLSKSLLQAGGRAGISGLTRENVGTWIKQNTRRVNIFLRSELGIPVLNLLEAFLQCQLNPVFEGFASQRPK